MSQYNVCPKCGSDKMVYKIGYNIKTKEKDPAKTRLECTVCHWWEKL